MKCSLSWLLLASCLVALCHSAAVNKVKKQAPDALSYIEENDEGVVDETLDALSEDERIKRSGGKQIAGFVGNRIKSGIQSGIQLGISSIASASSGKGGHGVLSKGDGHGRGYGHTGHGYEYGHHEEHPVENKKTELWDFKKSIVSTLLQAVKAITGGVIGLSGKVTGAAGHVVEAKGRLLQTAGESIYGFGKHVSQKAIQQPPVLTHHHVPHITHTHYESHAPVGHYGSSGHGSGPPAPLFSAYGAPSAPSSGYGAPHYHVARAAKPAPVAHHKSDVKAGLLILKPINVPSHSNQYQQQSNNLYDAPSAGYDSYAPPPKPVGRTKQLLSQAEPPSDYHQSYAAPPKPVGRTKHLSQAEPPSDYQQSYAAPQNHGYTQLDHEPSTNYKSYVSPPRAIQRSYNVAPVQYYKSLGYELPSVEYEY